jgi:hypothetical protein
MKETNKPRLIKVGYAIPEDIARLFQKLAKEHNLNQGKWLISHMRRYVAAHGIDSIESGE